MSTHYYNKVFQAGDMLFNENETSFHFFMIESGKVEVFKTGTDGKRIPLGIISEGQSLGELSMIDRHPRSASAIALTDVHAVVVTEEGGLSLLNELPSWASGIMLTLVERLRKMDAILMAHGVNDPEVLREIAFARMENKDETSISRVFRSELEKRAGEK